MEWIKSSFCPRGSDSCVEVARAESGIVHIRRATSAGPSNEMVLTSREWDVFLKGAKAGEFDYPGDEVVIP